MSAHHKKKALNMPFKVPKVVDISLGGNKLNRIGGEEKDHNEYGKDEDISAHITSPTASHAEVVAHACKLLASITSKSSDVARIITAKTSDVVRMMESPKSDQAVDQTNLVADDSSHVSSPTVSCGTFSDDDFSICSTEDLLALVKNRLQSPTANFDNDDLLSESSSLNSHRQRQISTLRKKLHTSEMTKLELLNQCAELWSRLENSDCHNAKVKEYRQQNVKLREESATIERDFMNEVSKLVHQMTELNSKYTETISKRDDRIGDMEMEIKELKKQLGVDHDEEDKDT